MESRTAILARAGVAVCVCGALSLLTGTAVSLFPDDPFEGYLAGSMVSTSLLSLTYFLLLRGGAGSRRRAFVLHSVLGLASGLFWMVFVLSGVVLMFRPEIEMLENGWRRVEPLPSAASPDAWLAAVAERADLEAAREVQIHWPHGDHDPAVIQVIGEQGQRFDVDPYRATVLEGAFSSIMPKVRDLHTHLLLDKPGRWIGGLASLATAWLLLSGVTMGHRVFREAFRLRVRGGGWILLSDLHKRIGLWTLPFLALYAFTGVAYELGDVVGYGPRAMRFEGDQWAMYRAAGSPPSFERDVPQPTPPPSTFVRTMQELLPGTEPHMMRILAHGDAEAVVSLRGARPGDLAPRGGSLLLNVRGATGEILQVKNVETLGPFERTNLALLALHFGEYGNAALRLVHAVASTAIGVLPILGMLLWCMRPPVR